MINDFVRVPKIDQGVTLAMTDRGCGAWLTACVLPAVVVGATLTTGGEPAALPLVKELPRAPHFLPVEGGAAPGPAPGDDRGGSEGGAPFAELTEALAAARAKLEQLDRAAEALAGAAGLRAELTAKEAELAAKTEENQRLLAELQTLRARRAEWQRAEDAAQAQIAGLAQALDQATAEAKKLDGELAAVRWQNAQLSTSLNSARTEQEAARAETQAVQAELGARVDALMATAENSTAEIRRLSEELADRGEALEAANRAQEQLAARTADLQQALDGAGDQLDRVRGQLGATSERLNEVNAALSAAEQERDTALGELDKARSGTDRLRDALATAEADLARTRSANQELTTRLAGLEEAAVVATDAARQNLQAVEHQIAALNSTLVKADLPPDGTATTAGVEARDAASDATPAMWDQNKQDIGAERSTLTAAPAAGPGEPGNGELALIKLSESAAPASPHTLAQLTAALPVESRIQAQSLLADLEAVTDPQGVKLIVPGGELFTMNGGEVRDTAHDSLAKVAELINLYKSQPVLIVGHTDAIGARDYNQTLSERRAGLVRQFFIDHFDVAAARLSTRGMGEQEPIASNATAAGRRANRRVEVLILN
jgi:outer membrane protein OmpA-like peptidoglycan-associated protein/predicted  nucleic acid-binding Zn-ribbon protein